jgi:hypothetical protein
MVFTHFSSNLLLAAVAFAPNLPVASGLLIARAALSQMDIPTRQAYVMTLVEPEERTAATAYTNTVRYLARPLGPRSELKASTGVAWVNASGDEFQPVDHEFNTVTLDAVAWNPSGFLVSLTALPAAE